MRGVACAGALPTLNLDSGNEQVAIVAEALSRMHEQMAQLAAESQLRDRAELTAQLDRLHTTAAMQRKALHSYLDELRSREDEAGAVLRTAAFASQVEVLVEEQRRAAAVAASSPGPHVHDLIRYVRDPATFEALLEVQRLDEALENTPRTRAQGDQPVATAAAAAVTQKQLQPEASAAISGRRGPSSRSPLSHRSTPHPPQQQPQPQPQSRQPLSAPTVQRQSPLVQPLLPLPSPAPHPSPVSRPPSAGGHARLTRAGSARRGLHAMADGEGGRHRWGGFDCGGCGGDGTFLTATDVSVERHDGGVEDLASPQVAAMNAVDALTLEVHRLQRIGDGEGGQGNGLANRASFVLSGRRYPRALLRQPQSRAP